MSFIRYLFPHRGRKCNNFIVPVNRYNNILTYTFSEYSPDSARVPRIDEIWSLFFMGLVHALNINIDA